MKAFKILESHYVTRSFNRKRIQSTKQCWKRAHSSRLWIYGDTTKFFGFFSKSVASCSNVMFSPIKKRGFYCKIGLVKVTKCHAPKNARG